MRVLWLTNTIMPEHASALGRKPDQTGGWMSALAEALCKTGLIELGIATNVPGSHWTEKQINDKIYFSIPFPQDGIKYNALPATLVRDYQRAVDEFKPDIIHIHGTEYFHGLLTGRRHIKTPAVISIQGLISEIQKDYWGGMSLRDLVQNRTLRDWIRLDGLIEQKIKWKRRAKWEEEIFTANDAFIGRTLWDRAHTHRMNYGARYYHCDEVLRPVFYEAMWNLKSIQKYRIYAPAALYPIKGFHVLIKAVSLLRREFPDISVHTPVTTFYHATTGMERTWKNLRSAGYAKYLTNLIEKEGVGDHIFSLGALEAGQVANELKKAHVFVLPSMIENSSNSLAEAMMLGTPSIVTFAGGTPSMAIDGESALYFPPGDEAVLAEQIRRVFCSDNVAADLSHKSRMRAEKRNLKEMIVERMMNIYKSEIDICGNKG